MARIPYNGASRKLVLAFDIGTTFSGSAYAFLDPGRVPEIHSVTKCVFLTPYYLTVTLNWRQVFGQPRRWVSESSFDPVL